MHEHNKDYTVLYGTQFGTEVQLIKAQSAQGAYTQFKDENKHTQGIKVICIVQGSNPVHIPFNQCLTTIAFA